MSIGQKAVNTSKCCSLEGKGFTQSITYDKTRPRRTLEMLNGRPLLISEYTYDNMGRIASETAGGCTTTYTYDEYGHLIEEENEALDKTFQYEYNEVGNIVYLDDAWGNCTIKGTTTNYIVAHANPIRYRGYYYDEDTKLYYLNSRYYNPEWRRFISPDNTNYLNPESVNGLNLYCYCGNDPTNFVDPSGHSMILSAILVGAIVGTVVGGGFEIGKQVLSNGWNISQWDWGQIGLSALGGGVAGAISSISLGSGFVGYLSSFALGGVGSVAGGLISGSVGSWESAGMAFLVGGTANVLGKGVADIINKIKVNQNISIVASRANRIASMSAKKKSLAIWNMIGEDNFSRNAFKSWGHDEILHLFMTNARNQLFINSANGLTRYVVYSALVSSLTSGWY